MLDNTTKRLIGLIGTALIGIFVFALAESISSGFAGFSGGLPFWIIVSFVMGLALFDYLEETFPITDGVKLFFAIGAIAFCGAALVYASWGASTLFEVGKDVRIRSLGTTDDPFLVDGVWPKLFWYGAAFGFVALTFLSGLLTIRKFSQK